MITTSQSFSAPKISSHNQKMMKEQWNLHETKRYASLKFQTYLSSLWVSRKRTPYFPPPIQFQPPNQTSPPQLYDLPLQTKYSLTVCSCQVTYAFQSESTLYSCLNVKKFLPRTRCEIWRWSDWNWTQTQNHLVLKWTLNHLANHLHKSFGMYTLAAPC